MSLRKEIKIWIAETGERQPGPHFSQRTVFFYDFPGRPIDADPILVHFFHEPEAGVHLVFFTPICSFVRNSSLLFVSCASILYSRTLFIGSAMARRQGIAFGDRKVGFDVLDPEICILEKEKRPSGRRRRCCFFIVRVHRGACRVVVHRMYLVFQLHV